MTPSVAQESGAIGIDLGGTNLKLALLDGDNRIRARLTVPTGGAEGHGAVIERMIDGVSSLRAQNADIDVEGIGIGVPGEVDMATGITGDLPNLPGRWRNVPVAPAIAEATGLPVGMINDAKAFALAEYRLGAAAGADTALCVTVGTGIGSAVIAHGQILYGVGAMAGEIGHLILQPEGPRCTCGNLGCAETLANGPAIVGEAVRTGGPGVYDGARQHERGRPQRDHPRAGGAGRGRGRSGSHGCDRPRGRLVRDYPRQRHRVARA